MLSDDKKNLVLTAMAGVLCLSAAVVARDFLGRGIWFDEALTILEFAVWPDSLPGVYLNYSIPNNHILYSMLMRLWLNSVACFFSFSNPILRLPSLLCGMLFLLSSLLLWRRHCSAFSCFIVLLAFSASPLFAIYATATRGYIFSMLAVSLAIAAVLVSCENRKAAYAGYWMASLVAVGIMPNNVVAIFAVSLLPFVLGKLSLGAGNLAKYSLVPFACLLLFYLPILPKFIRVLSIKEGWTSNSAAMLSFHLSTLLVFIVPLGLSLPSVFRRGRSARSAAALWAVVFALPSLFFLFRTPSPFPRTFLCILPVWMFLFAAGISRMEERIRASFPAKAAHLILFAAALLCAGAASVVFAARDSLSNIVSRGGQDDFFSPYFTRKDFNPDRTVERLIELSGKQEGLVFADIGSDHPSLTFSAKRFGLGDGFIVHDRPRARVEKFPVSDMHPHAFIVAEGEYSAKATCERFGLVLAGEEEGGGLKQRIFRARCTSAR
jgi:hypothetical protein